MRKYTSCLTGIAVAIALVACSSTGSETEKPATRATARALTLDPIAPGNYVYFRSNASGWGADWRTRMYEESPGVFAKTFQVNEQWMLQGGDQAIFTLTNSRWGWGSVNEHLSDPAHTGTPNSELCAASGLADGGQQFKIQYPALGTYTVRLHADTLTYTVAAGTEECAQSGGCGPDLQPGEECIVDDFDDGADGWSTQAAISGASLFSDNNGVITITNNSPNDARFQRQLELQPNSAYTVTARIMSLDIEGGARGASVGIENPPAFSTFTSGIDCNATDRDGSCSGMGDISDAEVRFSFTTDESGQATLYARLGGDEPDDRPTGSAIFDDITIRRLATVSSPSGKIQLALENDLAVQYQAALDTWLERLEIAYWGYYDLVGEEPFPGINKILVIEHDLWGLMVSGNPIQWLDQWVPQELAQIQNTDDWSFGALHEIGHNFDLDWRWNFDPEWWANFKMNYVLENVVHEYTDQYGNSQVALPRVHQKQPVDVTDAQWEGAEIRDLWGRCVDSCTPGDARTVDACNSCTCVGNAVGGQPYLGDQGQQTGHWDCTADTCTAGDKRPYGDGCQICEKNSAGNFRCQVSAADAVTMRFLGIVDDVEAVLPGQGWKPFRDTFAYYNEMTPAGAYQFNLAYQDPDDDGVNEYTFQRAQFAAFIDVLEQQVRTIPGLEDYDVAAQFADHEMQFIEEWLNPPTLGDVNADGAVDIVDAMMISNYYNGGSPSPFHWRVADVTADSQIDDADVDCITNYYVGNVTQLFCL